MVEKSSKECDFCIAFAKAKLNRWTKLSLPFEKLCQKHNKEVKTNPNFVRLQKEVERLIEEREKRPRKPWPRLMWGKNGLGKIRFKSYFKDVAAGVSPLTWWANEDFGNPYEELKNMIGISLKDPEIEITKPKKYITCKCSVINDWPRTIEKLGLHIFKHFSPCQLT